MPFSLSRAVIAFSTFCAALSVAAQPSSYLGMGSRTGTPSGDVRAAVKYTDPLLVDSTGKDEAKEDGRPLIVRSMQFSRPIKIGIQQSLSTEQNGSMVQYTSRYLREMFGDENITVYHLSDRDLATALRTNQVDFFMSAVNYYTLEEALGGVQPVATLWPVTTENPSAASASVIIMKNSGERQSVSLSLGVLTGRKIVAGERTSLEGWLAAAREIVRSQNISYEGLTERVTFLGEDSEKIVQVLRENEHVAGVLPACELERLEHEGLIEADEFAVVNSKTDDGLVCRHSTEAYPGWVFGTINETDPTLRKAMSSVLFGMSGLRYPAEWTMPASGRSVYDLFYNLKIGPYQDLAKWSFKRFVRENSDAIALSLLIVFLALSYMTALSILVRRRTVQLREALDEHARVEVEVEHSREHIANLERTGIVGQMSTIIAHELKQPLGAIANYGNGLLRRLNRGNLDPKSFETALSEIVLQAERASQIVERVRSYAKHDFPPRTVADLSIIIENAIQTFRRSRTTKAKLIVRMYSRSMAEVDSWEVELAILNLLKNAADAVSTVEDPVIEVCLEPDGKNNWRLSVADNGPRVSDEQMAKFFMPLQTSKGASGMGLGLSIVANIAERHAGHIRVERNGENGVKFIITIPRLVHLTSGDTSVEVVMGPGTVSIYEAGGNGSVVRKKIESGSADKTVSDKSEEMQEVSENTTNIPKTVHTDGLSRMVRVMEDGTLPKDVLGNPSE